MLTELRFKNWRSLRDVTISNLTPITVFIGANSSGKSNILDALHFLKRSINVGVNVAVFNWGGLDKIRTLTASRNDNVEVNITFNWDSPSVFSDGMTLNADNTGILYKRNLAENGVYFPELLVNQGFGPVEGGEQSISRMEEIAGYSNHYKQHRWQLIRDDMAPPQAIPSNNALGNPYSIDARARNLPVMLDFMQRQAPDTYDALQSDIVWLLNHVEKLEAHRDERETRMLIREKHLAGKEAPTISVGTTRLISILTAYYALDIRSPDRPELHSPDLPGLVVIDEPDIGVHPLLLSRLVELLRVYTNPLNEHPRQFILTTHNPMFLNLFQPEEVHIVERNEQGETTVNRVDQGVVDIWREHYGDYRIGDVWTTRLLGGVPE